MSVLEILVVDDGDALRAYDCRDILGMEEIASPGDAGADEVIVRLGRVGTPREIRCRRVLGFFALAAKDIRPLPPILSGRIAGEAPWAVGIIDRGLCLLY